MLVTTLVALSPGTVSATEDVTANRLAGVNRYATAGGIAVTSFPNGTTTVVLASGERFPDALAGSALAGAVGGPIVLTARDHLSPEAEEAIEELDPDNVIVLGGTDAVSDATASAINDAQVTRVSGVDRYATAAAAARRIGAGAVAELNGLRTAIIASGSSFVDALAGGGVANNGEGNGVYPVLLVSGGVPEATSAALEELQIEQALILGGTAAVSSAVEAQIETDTGNPAVRVAGADRYATAAAIAELMITELASPGTSVLLANGEGFADALAAGVLSGVRLSPIVLTPPPSIPDETEAFLEGHESTVAQVIAIGGTSAVSQTALDQAERAAETDPEGEIADDDELTVTPTSPSTQDNNTSRAYTVDDIGDAESIDIALMPCTNVGANSDGRTFRNTNTNTIADSGAEAASAPDRASTIASITRVNGAGVTLTNNDYADDVEPKSDGTVTFVVSGPSSNTAAGGCVRPVAFVDDDEDSALDVTSANPGEPAEAVGVGGAIQFQASDAGGSGGTFTEYDDHNVTSHTPAQEDANTFEACPIVNDEPELVDTSADCATFHYDTNDVFKIGSTSLTFADWETRLSPGDDVSIPRYFATATGVSQFLLVDEAPPPPTILDARESDGDVTITYREPTTQQIEGEYRAYRLAVPEGACPTAPSSYGEVVATADPLFPGAPGQMTDETAEPGTRYCYVLVSVDWDDESVPSAPAEVTTEGEAPPDDGPTLPTLPPLEPGDLPDPPTTPSTPPPTTSSTAPPTEDVAPFLVSAEGDNEPPTSTDVSLNDIHWFTFSEPMSPTIVTSSYEVTDGDDNVATIACTAARCTLSNDGTELKVILPQPVTHGLDVPNYPVIVTDVTGWIGLDTNEVDLEDSFDRRIDADDREE